jgi:ribosomal protein S18 acetylase RimI-like enzyme
MAAEIRPARSADLPAVQRVARAAWYAAHEPIVGEESVETFLAEYYSREALEERLGRRTVFLVAVDDAVVGFAVAGPTDDPTTYVLGRIYVSPDRWGEGIGRRLLEDVHGRARERGGERMRLGVMAENDRAVRFYEAAGYERVGDRVDERIGTTTYEYELVL